MERGSGSKRSSDGTMDLFFVILFVGLIAYLTVRALYGMRIAEQKEQRSIAEHSACWNAMTRQQQREAWLANFCIPSNYLPWVVLSDDGEPCLPNFYLGQGMFAMCQMQMPGDGTRLFSDAEVEEARAFALSREDAMTESYDHWPHCV